MPFVEEQDTDRDKRLDRWTIISWTADVIRVITLPEEGGDGDANLAK